MKMKISLTLLLVLILTDCFAQEKSKVFEKQKDVAFNLGYTQFKDENLHPKVFQGLNIGSLFTHSNITNHISEYSVGLKISLMNTEYEEFPTSVNILIIGHYKFLFTILQNERLRYYLGPVADLQFGTSAYLNWDESHLYYANYLGAGISNRFCYSLGNRLFEFNIDLPVLSCICRPEFNRQYKIDDMSFTGIFKNLSSNPEAGLLNKNFALRSSLEMKYFSRSKKLRSVGYAFRYHYMLASSGYPYQNLENSFFYKFIF